MLNVNVALEPNAGASAFVNTAGEAIMAGNITSAYSIKLPATVDYVVGIDNNSQQNVNYSLTISITDASN
ncbi:MAG: hypothetical protein LWX83_12615 [Anaerolineae bacterium]|nr:hypothetical protein [Anaerolineae bacterium]